MARALIITGETRGRLQKLMARAASRPVNMLRLGAVLATPDGKLRHIDQMTEQSVGVHDGYLVTYSVETGHPCGTCRHMSVSVDAPDKLPSMEAVWMLAEELGFEAGLQRCTIYLEDLPNRKAGAVNVLQPFETVLPRAAANEGVPTGAPG